MAVDFGNLYDYSTGNGIVLPQTSSVRETIENAFIEIFGGELDVTPETAIGRIIEALTLLFVDVLGVNAQNANNFNPSIAIGTFLDALGKLFNVSRLDGESDEAYRARLVQSQSRGTGYAQSIRQALSNVSGVTSICVLENGHNYPVVLPTPENGIAVPAHSIFVCVAGGSNADVARAIIGSKSAGCGYTETSEYGTPVTETVVDTATGSSNTVVFYRPTERNILIEVDVKQDKYTGSDIVASTKEAIKALFRDNPIAAKITPTEIASRISTAETGIVCTNVEITSSGSVIPEVTVLPYQYVNMTDSKITVNVV